MTKGNSTTTTSNNALLKPSSRISKPHRTTTTTTATTASTSSKTTTTQSLSTPKKRKILADALLMSPQTPKHLKCAAVQISDDLTRKLDKSDVDLLDVDQTGTVRLITGEAVLDKENRPLVLTSPMHELQRRYISNVKAKRVHGRSLLDELNSIAVSDKNDKQQ